MLKKLHKLIFEIGGINIMNKKYYSAKLYEALINEPLKNLHKKSLWSYREAKRMTTNAYYNIPNGSMKEIIDFWKIYDVIVHKD